MGSGFPSKGHALQVSGQARGTENMGSEGFRNSRAVMDREMFVLMPSHHPVRQFFSLFQKLVKLHKLSRHQYNVPDSLNED